MRSRCFFVLIANIPEADLSLGSNVIKTFSRYLPGKHSIVAAVTIITTITIIFVIVTQKQTLAVRRALRKMSRCRVADKKIAEEEEEEEEFICQVNKQYNCDEHGT